MVRIPTQLGRARSPGIRTKGASPGWHESRFWYVCPKCFRAGYVSVVWRRQDVRGGEAFEETCRKADLPCLECMMEEGREFGEALWA